MVPYLPPLLKKKKTVSSRAKFHTANYSMDALFIPRTSWSSSKNIASDIQNKTSKGLPPTTSTIPEKNKAAV